MSELAKQESKQSVLVSMAGKFSVEPKQLLSTLKNTAFKGATDDQMMALCVVANEYNLNPFTKEIYAFPAKGGGIVPVIGADGWYSMVNGNPDFDGVSFKEDRDDKGKLISTTCTLYRKSRAHPCEVTEYVSENKRNTEPWNNQPTRMNRHRAFIQCARIAFGISLADPEDAERTQEYSKTRNITPRNESLTTESNPFEVSATPEPKTLPELMERDGVSEGDLLTVLSDAGVCKPDTMGIEALSEDQISHVVSNWDQLFSKEAA